MANQYCVQEILFNMRFVCNAKMKQVRKVFSIDDPDSGKINI